jgi:hypothetical protein
VGVNSQNLVLGPARIYWAPQGTTEPADLSVTNDGWLTPPPSPWTDFGGTDGGVNVEIDTTYTDLTVDQIIMAVGARLTELKMQVTAGLAEITNANINEALNNIAQTGSGTGFVTMEIPVGSSATQPDYSALCIDGWGPLTAVGGPALRRVIVRKVLSTAKVALTSDKKTQQKIDTTWNAYFVGEGVNPIRIITATA